MDNLKDIISTLDSDEIKEFRVFINRIRQKKERKDLQLFDLLVQDKKRSKTILELYPEMNKNAYHSLRKRLIKRITEFIALKNAWEDDSAQSKIMEQLSLSKYLFRKNKEQVAWIFLRNAETLALKVKEYQLLNTVYYTQIEFAESQFATPLREIISKKKLNMKNALLDDRINTSNHLIKLHLLEARQRGQEFDIDRMITKILTEQNLKKDIVNNPRLVFNVISIIRSNILAKREFVQFEPYVIEHYERLLQQNLFDQHNHLYKVNFLYIIAHVLYRNRRFLKSETYLENMLTELNLDGQGYYERLYPSYILLKCNICAYLAKTDESINLLEKHLLSLRKNKSTHALHFLSTVLNLCAQYCQVSDYKMAAKTIVKIPYSDKRLISLLGLDRTLTKLFLECALYLELGNVNYVESLIFRIEKLFELRTVYVVKEMEIQLLNIIKALYNNPFVLEEDSFKVKVFQFLKFKELFFDDMQKMIFFVWLKAKIEGKNHSEVILEIGSV